MSSINITLIKDSIHQLMNYMIHNQYKGYDPYDLLGSPLFSLPIFNSRLVRFGAQQIGKRVPINLHKMLAVPKGLNPVTIGLSIQAYSYLSEVLPEDSIDLKPNIESLFSSLLELKSKGYSGSCWGYEFDWEARYTTINAFVPTSVATGIITNALFEHYLLTKEDSSKDICIDATPFILNDLNKSYDGEIFCYSYSPVDSQYVLNASMKAARLLSQVFSINGDPLLAEEAAKAVEFVVNQQQSNGSWPYSRHDARTWSDNYHTGYILDCLDSYIKNTGDTRFSDQLHKGLEYYVHNFFTDDAIPKFYDNKVYPIDSTAAAQSILTLSRFDKLELAGKVASWYINHMQAESGAFYFRKFKYYTDKQIFMRWSNAWMLVGLSYLLYKHGTKK